MYKVPQCCYSRFQISKEILGCCWSSFRSWAAPVRVPAKGCLAVIHPPRAGTRVLGRFLGVSVSTTPAKIIRTDFSLIPLLLPTWHFACMDQKRDQIGSR